MEYSSGGRIKASSSVWEGRSNGMAGLMAKGGRTNS